MKMTQIIANDLVQHLEDENVQPYEIADIIASLFEFTGNCQFTLWQVTDELFNFAVTPLESEVDPFET